MADAGKRLIVNADDFGRTAGINAGVFASHRQGLVTSATLMVAYPAAAAAAAELGRAPRLGVGLHVALTGGPPVLPPERLPSLVDAAGVLPRGPEGVEGADRGEVAAEVGAQLERFCELTGRLPTHLDGHHHVHSLPVVRSAVVALAREHGLPVRAVTPEMGEELRRDGVTAPDSFVRRFYADGARLEVLLEILTALTPGTSELMCHPGEADAELAAMSTYVGERRREVEALTDPAALRAVAEHGIRLVHYGALAAGA